MPDKSPPVSEHPERPEQPACPVRDMRRAPLRIVAAGMLLCLVTSACTSETADLVVDPEPVSTQAPLATVAPTSAALPTEPPSVPAPSSTPPTATPAVETTATPTEPTCAPGGNQYQFEVVGVAPDDPDGGLVTHSGPGADTPELGVLAWDSGNIFYLDCAFASNGAAWWQVGVGAESVWVNSRYLGDRRIAADSLAANPCSREQSTVLPSGSTDAARGAVIVADIDVESSADCDRVVIEMAQGFEGYDSVVTSLDPGFGAEFMGSILHTDSEIQIELAGIEPFTVGVDVESWRDVATSEQNVALLMEDYDTGSTLYVGWGTGEAFLRFAQEPTPRIIIDIFQEPTPENVVVGPIVGAAVLFDPIQRDLVGPGVTLPITLRGWSRGFEASSVLKLARWDQINNRSPLEWQGELFGVDADRLFTDGVEFGEPFNDFGVPYWPFTTTGYFEITIVDIEAGAYQLAIEPSSGCISPGGTGQQFRVIAAPPDGADHVPALPFTIEQRWVGDGFEQSQTVTSVLGVEAVSAAIDAQC